jgi:hypothetical protein
LNHHLFVFVYAHGFKSQGIGRRKTTIEQEKNPKKNNTSLHKNKTLYDTGVNMRHIKQAGKKTYKDK